MTYTYIYIYNYKDRNIKGITTHIRIHNKQNHIQIKTKGTTQLIMDKSNIKRGNSKGRRGENIGNYKKGGRVSTYVLRYNGDSIIIRGEIEGIWVNNKWKGIYNEGGRIRGRIYLMSQWVHNIFYGIITGEKGKGVNQGNKGRDSSKVYIQEVQREEGGSTNTYIYYIYIYSYIP
jgi:hypothetical protein